MSKDPYLDYLQKKGLAEAQAKIDKQKAEDDAKRERRYKTREEIRSTISLVIATLAFFLSVFSLLLQCPWF